MHRTFWGIHKNTFSLGKKLPLYIPNHGDQDLERLIKVPRLAGVVQGRLIQFIPL